MTSSASLFFNGLGGPSLGAKLVLTNDRPSIISIITRLFPSGGEKKMRRILHDSVGRTPRHVSYL